MNPAPLLFLGTFFAVATSWLGFVVMPQLQIGHQTLVVIEDTGVAYPPKLPGMAKQGEAVYRANGCFYCHTQQVRPKGYGADFERRWGGRNGPVQSLAQDYIQAEPVMLGSQRVGPDLTNIGLREIDEQSHLKHLYDPKSRVQNSTMPPYRFLFERHKLKLGEKVVAPAFVDPTAADYKIVPTDDARALVAYLVSRHSEAILYEAPAFPSPAVKSTNAPAAKSTNAPAASGSTSTNSPK